LKDYNVLALKPYPAMKDSGVPWLGEVPEHWEVLPALAAYKTKLVKNTGMAEKAVLSLSYGHIIVKPTEKLRGLVPESFETYQIVEPGDIIVRTTDLQNDHTSLRIGHSKNRGIITAAYMCLETTDRISNEFGYQFLNTYDLLKIIYGFGSGLRQNLDFADIKRMPVLVPPKNEQAAIVRFLDHYDRKIRRYIRTKQKLIKLLEEEKQAIIHRAVTRGLDPNVRLKPSGVEWLGDIPEHWEVRRLKSLVGESIAGPYGSSLTKAMYTSAGYRVYGQQQVIPDNFSAGDYYISEEKYEQMKQYRVFPGDVLVSVMGTVGRVAVVPEDVEPGIINPRLVRYRPDYAWIRPRYLQLAMMSPPARAQLTEESKGTTMEGLNMQILGRLLLGIPPLLEQDAILAAVHAETDQLSKAMHAANRNITLLREYRTRLIADVVTGKLDVREAAAQLPEEPDEPSEGGAKDFSPLQDDGNGLTDEGKDTEEDDLETVLQEAILAD
jgi:type I restriction enzyme S subunit